jgi:hypothetical protein
VGEQDSDESEDFNSMECSAIYSKVIQKCQCGGGFRLDTQKFKGKEEEDDDGDSEKNHIKSNEMEVM